MATELPEKPESREESYLADIAGQEVELPEKPLSRKEQYLAYIAENGGGGGGGGTSNFDQLTNRPKYNGTTMTGSTDIPEVKTYTAGSNVAISDQNAISATDTTYSDFTGTDGTAAGAAGLVPAPATTDAGKFLKADGTWDSAGGGSAVIELTSADYDYPDANPDGVALWRLDPGMYTRSSSVTWYAGSGPGDRVERTYTTIIIVQNTTYGNSGLAFAYGDTDIYNTQRPRYYKLTGGSGVRYSYVLTGGSVVNNLTTSDVGSYGPLALDARQGKTLKDLVDSLAVRAAGAPTTSTVGQVGTLYEDTTNGKLYQCTDTTGGTYTWAEVGAGGFGPTVVQTTGTSQTDIMSQNAVTSMVFSDPEYKKNVRIGNSASASGYSVGIGDHAVASANYSVAIGNGTNTSSGGTAIGDSAKTGGSGAIAIGARYNNGSYGAKAHNPGSIAIGAYSKAGTTDGMTNPGQIALGCFSSTSAEKAIALGDGASATAAGAVAVGTNASATTAGEMNIGSTNTSFGYNSSNYRLLSGLYDGQSAHDAVNLGQITPTTDSAAPTTSTAGRLGETRIDTTDYSAYMCVDTTGGSYTWKKITA